MRHEDMAGELLDTGEVSVSFHADKDPVVISRFEAVKFSGKNEFAVLDRVTDEVISEGFSSLQEAKSVAAAMQNGMGFGGLYRKAVDHRAVHA